MWAYNDLSCQLLAATPNNTLERTAGKYRSRLATAWASWPAVQLGRQLFS